MEGGKGREAETLTHTESRRQKSNQAERKREGAGGLVALHNTQWSKLVRRSWWGLQHWGTSFYHWPSLQRAGKPANRNPQRQLHKGQNQEEESWDT